MLGQASYSAGREYSGLRGRSSVRQALWLRSASLRAHLEYQDARCCSRLSEDQILITIFPLKKCEFSENFISQAIMHCNFCYTKHIINWNNKDYNKISIKKIYCPNRCYLISRERSGTSIRLSNWWRTSNGTSDTECLPVWDWHRSPILQLLSFFSLVSLYGVLYFFIGSFFSCAFAPKKTTLKCSGLASGRSERWEGRWFAVTGRIRELAAALKW